MYPEEVLVCKKYSDGTAAHPAVTIRFSVVVNPSNLPGDPGEYDSPTSHDFTLQPNQCRALWWTGGAGHALDAVRIEELPVPGYTTTSQVTTATGFKANPYAAAPYVFDPQHISNDTTYHIPTNQTVVTGAVGSLTLDAMRVIFTNTPVPPPVLGSIGNFVWNDANSNGLQDVGEAGIAGVVLTLGGAGSATTTTDANGHYLFPNLSAGTYTVSVALPSGFSASPANVGSNDAIDSDGSGVSVVIAGNNDLSVDFGVFETRGTSSCGYTQGYWKNHEEKWPAPYSPTARWMQPGNLTPVTWDGLMGMSVTGGNSYMQLAHQWIAATLNWQSGAPMRADVLAVLNQSKTWLIAKTPANGAVPNFKDSQATAWAKILDDYNNGKLGTPHCN